MGFFSGLKKVVSTPVKAVGKLINTGTDIIADTATFVAEVPQEVLRGAGQATKEVGKGIKATAKEVGPAGAIGYAVGGPLGLGAGTFFNIQQRARTQQLDQQRDLAGLGLSAQEIAYLQSSTPLPQNPFTGFMGGQQPVIIQQPVVPETLPPIAFPRGTIEPSNNNISGNFLIIGAIVGGGLLLLRGLNK
jgi:hypothetical protein|tara:strand:- start:1202 stop:1771 length:570 start_codon:yes stop_codon:yes gene_type:complete